MTYKEDVIGAGMTIILSLFGMFVGYYCRDVLYFYACLWVLIWATIMFEIALSGYLKERKERRDGYVD